LSFVSVYQANERYCPRNKDSKGRPAHSFCPEFVDATAPQFDLVLVNGGHHYKLEASYRNDLSQV
jgi:hypothetical protein